MAYVKYTWENLPNVTTPISKANLDHLETQYDEADADLAIHAALPRVHHVGFEEIGDTTLGAPAASVSFGGIASGYGIFLLLWHYVAGDDNDIKILALTFNADGAANYDYTHNVYGALGTAVNAASFISIGEFADDDGNDRIDSGHVFITNRSSIQKVVWGQDAQIKNAGGGEHDILGGHTSGKWRNVADEIATITITASGGNFLTGARFVLLGVKT